MLCGLSMLLSPAKYGSHAKSAALPAALMAALALVACEGAKFGGSSPSPAAKQATQAGASSTPGTEPVPVNNNTDANGNGGVPTLGTKPSTTSTTTQTGLAGLINTIGQIVSSTTSNTQSTTQTNTITVPTNMSLCSDSYYVPATANPYLAGSSSASTLTYTLNSGDPQTPTDTAGANSPVLVAPTNTACIAPGAKLYFSVQGAVTYNKSKAEHDANGDTSMVVQHQLGGVNGISQIIAPIDALIGVFLDDSDPSAKAAPNGLDFSSQTARDYTTLNPDLGVVFFIGTGLTSGGQLHQIVVPSGATRLYFAVMDEYQWNNNVGGLHGAIMTAKSN